MCRNQKQIRISWLSYQALRVKSFICMTAFCFSSCMCSWTKFLKCPGPKFTNYIKHWVLCHESSPNVGYHRNQNKTTLQHSTIFCAVCCFATVARFIQAHVSGTTLCVLQLSQLSLINQCVCLCLWTRLSRAYTCIPCRGMFGGHEIKVFICKQEGM